MNRQELNQLIDDALDGICSESDFLRLEAELHIDPEARQAYYDRLKLHTVLQLEAEEQSEVSNVSPFRSRLKQVLPAMSLAAGVLILASLGSWKLGHDTGEQSELAVVEPVAAGFGVLAELADAKWIGNSIGRGDLLPQGLIQLQEGVAQLELFSGVTVIVEGSSQFELISDMEMAVHSGKIRAIVPEPARGFRIRTATGDVVDLGTEFALDISESHADVHVLNGEIEWHPLSKPMQHLTEGDSIRWSQAGPSQPDSVIDQFVGLEDLAERRTERQLSWLNHTRELGSDPRLLVYYPMTQQVERNLVDKSIAKANGTIVRAKRSIDRWEQPNRALSFSPTGSRVRVSIPGEHSALTLFCWVRIDSLDKWYNSLFLTDGHELNEPHWQIMNDGRLFFSVKAHDAKRDKHIAYSPPIWTPQDSGQWMQIATVYDSSIPSTTHYVNGKPISQDILPKDMVVNSVQIGSASIGNWSEPKRADPNFAVRNLNGAIDEFAIFSAALTDAEIADLYEIGRP